MSKSTVEIEKASIDAIVAKLIRAAEADHKRLSQIKAREAAANLALEMKLDNAPEDFENALEEAVDYLESISTKNDEGDS